MSNKVFKNCISIFLFQISTGKWKADPREWENLGKHFLWCLHRYFGLPSSNEKRKCFEVFENLFLQHLLLIQQQQQQQQQQQHLSKESFTLAWRQWLWKLRICDVTKMLSTRTLCRFDMRSLGASVERWISSSNNVFFRRRKTSFLSKTKFPLQLVIR